VAPLTVFDHLAMHPFVADLPAGWLHRLAAYGRPVLRHPGVRLFHEGAPAANFWLLRTGAVALDFHVPGRGDIVIERIGPEGVVGWSWLLPPYRWSLGAVVAAECQAIQFDAAAVRRLLAEDPEFGREMTTRFLAVTAERLHAARVRLAEMYAYPPATPQLPSPIAQDQ
jgi:CRP/FNR family cyclic AMP-dependent transcriptional regulator